MYYLEYHGIEYPLIIDYSVVKKIAISQGLSTLKSLPDLDLETFEALEDLLYFSLQRGHKLEGIPFEIKREDIEDIFSECTGDFMKIVGECMPAVFSADDKIKKKK